MTASEFAFLTLGLVLGVPAARPWSRSCAADRAPRARSGSPSPQQRSAAAVDHPRGGRLRPTRPGSGPAAVRAPTVVDRRVGAAVPTLVRFRPAAAAEAGPRVGTGHPPHSVRHCGVRGRPARRRSRPRGRRRQTRRPCRGIPDQQQRPRRDGLDARGRRLGLRGWRMRRSRLRASRRWGFSPARPAMPGAGAGVGASGARANIPAAPSRGRPDRTNTRSADRRPAGACGEARRVADERCALAARAESEAQTARGNPPDRTASLRRPPHAGRPAGAGRPPGDPDREGVGAARVPGGARVGGPSPEASKPRPATG